MEDMKKNLINNMSVKEIDNMMKWVASVIVVGYVLEILKEQK